MTTVLKPIIDSLKSWLDIKGAEHIANLSRQLVETSGGGPLIAHVLHKAVQATVQKPGGTLDTAAQAKLLTSAFNGVMWEKLHAGSWKDTPMVFREAYSLSCILKCLVQLRIHNEPSTSIDEHTTARTAVDDLIIEAIKVLDMAVLMGGPLFRPLIDDLIQQLHDVHHKSNETESCEKVVENSQVIVVSLLPGQTPLQEQQQQQVDLPPDALKTNNNSKGVLLSIKQLPSLESFYTEHMHPKDTLEGVPVVVQGAMASWPAVTRWTDVEYLKRVAGLRMVPVELGSHYLAEGWGQELMTFNEFINKHLLLIENTTPGENTVQSTRKKGYLAQHNLFDQIPALERDIREPEYCSLGDGVVESVNAWLGPVGTVTPLHTDPWHNLLCQVVGRKYIRLYPPSSTLSLYPYETGITSNSSRVDVDAPDHEKFPEYGKEPFLECVLKEGEMLYIPPGWWHYVKSLTTSFSVSYWWH